ncbi:MAG: cryptochrome/photolyase family protein [bacterium]|nr:cryptochrome/photolyase family protein [bacterium]
MMNTPVSVLILADQLLERHPALEHALAQTDPASIRVVMVESARRFARHAYHKQKVALLKSAMRHYADRLRAQGYTVDHRRAATMNDGLREHVAAHRPARLITMAASEVRGRAWQRDTLADVIGIPVDVIDNTQFLVGQFDPFPTAEPDKRIIMESFYRKMRQHFGVLIDKNEPVGGAWNFDKQNRQPYPKGHTAPPRITFAPDAITQAALSEADESGGFGEIDGFDLAVTHEQAAAALDDFITNRLVHFGAYEDAMTTRENLLYHSFLSAYVNIGLLEPMQMIRAAEAAYHAGTAPINSVEGFIRQVIGWREFMYWQYWRAMPQITHANAWDARRPMPAFFWTGDTDMNCLHHVIGRVRRDAYAHHIERLMVLANFSTLAGLTPMHVNDWFLIGFIDAYEWVMIPNVLGMGLNADGGQIATKPYIASAHYINKMSDYCKGCRFNPKQRAGADACPYNTLYWHFLITHEAALRANPRFGPAVLGLKAISAGERAQIQAQAAAFLDHLPPYSPP